MQQILQYIDNQQDEMIQRLMRWVNINSGSANISGLDAMLSELKSAFAGLGAEMKVIALPPGKKIDNQGKTLEIPGGKALSLKKQGSSPVRVLLGGHYDTVFGAQSPFQKAERIDADRMKGPGIIDMKGGLIIMLKALEALERSSAAGKLGWEVLINPDEETGSSGSGHLFVEAAKRNDFGLLFEPSFPDGSLVSSRKGSVNYTLVVRGKAAHAGRDFHNGKSAIVALARFIHNADSINDPGRGVTVNFGFIEGGGPVNIVPDFALCRMNIRMNEPEDMPLINEVLNQLIEEARQHEEISLKLYPESHRGPKPFDPKSQILFECIKKCGLELGLNLSCQPSGGVSDGNILVEAGLPTIDTLGATGGGIHTQDEFIHLSSLKERAKLSALLLYQVASGELNLKELLHEGK